MSTLTQHEAVIRVKVSSVFEVDDVELPWTYPKNYFDYIHMRNLAQGIKDWPKLMQQAYVFVLSSLRQKMQ
jgi:hypothetical protein